MKNVKTTEQSVQDVKQVITLLNAANRGKRNLSDFILADLEANKGELICKTAQYLYSGKDGSQCQKLNSLQRMTKIISQDKENELSPVKITRVDRKTNECEIYPNEKSLKEFSTFNEIVKLIERNEGKTACNLSDEEAQTLVQMIGKMFS